MSVGSHFMLYSRKHNPAHLKSALESCRIYRKEYAPFARFSVRKLRDGWRFWRVM